MIRTWKGQTKEEFYKEIARNRTLTPEENKREWDEAWKKIEQQSIQHKNNSISNTQIANDKKTYLQDRKLEALQRSLLLTT